MVLEIILIIISIVLSAFFSSSEAAFLSIQKTKIFHMVNNKKKGADLVAQLLENKDKALKLLKSQLYELELRKKQEEKDKLEGNKATIK